MGITIKSKAMSCQDLQNLVCDKKMIIKVSGKAAVCYLPGQSRASYLSLIYIIYYLKADAKSFAGGRETCSSAAVDSMFAIICLVSSSAVTLSFSKNDSTERHDILALLKASRPGMRS